MKASSIVLMTERQFLSIAVVIYVVVGILALYLAYRVVKALVRLSARALHLFGDTAQAQVISLGLASLVFSRVIPVFFGVIIDFFARIFSGFSGVASRSIANLSDAGKDGLEPASVKLFLGVLSNCAEVFTSAFSNLRNFPLADLVLLLALGATLGTFLRTVESDNVDGRKQLWLFSYLASLSPAARKNATFALVLVIAGYLSVASLAAIPALQEPAAAPTEVSKERLQELLLKTKAEIGGVLANSGPGPNPTFATFEAWLSEVPKTPAPDASPQVQGTPAPIASAPMGPISSPSPAVAPSSPGDTGARTRGGPLSANDMIGLREILRTAKERRQDALSNYQRLVVALHDASDSALNTALSAYELENVDRRGRREAVRYFQEIADWYRRKLSLLRGRISDEIQNLQQGDEAATQNLSWLKDRLVQVDDPRDRESALSTSSSYVFNWYRTYPAPPDFQDSLPQRPKLGSYLGPFTFLASWLLGAESMPLALIVGLVGFGLLGSACSTFIRHRGHRHAHGTAVSDLTRVIIPGLSAAVVVFLVVEGGLSIFASGSGQPNP
jgi:hypothetical protein